MAVFFSCATLKKINLILRSFETENMEPSAVPCAEGFLLTLCQTDWRSPHRPGRHPCNRLHNLLYKTSGIFSAVLITLQNVPRSVIHCSPGRVANRDKVC